MKRANCIATLAVLTLSATAALAQAAPTPAPAPAPPRVVGSIAGHPGWPAAKPEDVKSPEAIIYAVYSVISGGKGQARDWNRMRSLFLPDAALIPTISSPSSPRPCRTRPMPSPSASRITFNAATPAWLLTVSSSTRFTMSSSSSATSLRSGAPTSPATTSTIPNHLLAASTASSSSKTATATGSSTSCGTPNYPTNPFLESICQTNSLWR